MVLLLQSIHIPLAIINGSPGIEPGAVSCYAIGRQGGLIMSYSKLVSYVQISPNRSVRKDKVYNPDGKVDKITIHHVAGDATVEALGALFGKPSRQASSNYGISSDGRIACFVEEEYRSWCSGSRENDYRAITIEVANCGGDPDWPVSDAAYSALLDLCEDICRRHDFRLNFTGDKTGNLTMHKWFQPTGCPGPYLEARFPDIATEVNRRLDGEKDVFYRVQCGAFRELKNAETLRDKLRSQGYRDAFIVEVERT